jgi:TetR/AcrR family transcriptional repressor of nem operon
MPRTTQAEFRQTRQKIVRAASAQIRTHGVHGVSLAKVMHQVGQTVGGYYNHFPSRQALVLEAFELAMDEEVQRWQRLSEKAGRRLAAREIAAEYLNPLHRDQPGNGCPLPAFATDFGREALEVMIATMLGAMVLARASAGSELSDEILDLTRQHLLEATERPSQT